MQCLPRGSNLKCLTAFGRCDDFRSVSACDIARSRSCRPAPRKVGLPEMAARNGPSPSTARVAPAPAALTRQ